MCPVPKHNGLVHRNHDSIFVSNLTSSVFPDFISLLQCLLRLEQRGETRELFKYSSDFFQVCLRL